MFCTAFRYAFAGELCLLLLATVALKSDWLMQTMLDEMKCGIKEYDWPDWWYFGKERRFLHAPEEVS